MSQINIKAFYQFNHIKVTKQWFDPYHKTVWTEIEPDNRYTPRCHKCNGVCSSVHSWTQRAIQDMPVIDAPSFVLWHYRKLRCERCGISIEVNPLIEPGLRITTRLGRYILDLCQYMTVMDIARHLGLAWKTVKAVHLRALQKKFSGDVVTGSPRVLMVDEISLKKGYHFLTVVADWDSGRVLWVGENRRYETLKGFFDSLSDEQRAAIEAVAIDMWDPYIKAVRECCSGAKIVFDQFHVVKAFSKVIDNVRNAQFRKASQADKDVIKGSKYLLLKNRINLRGDEKPRLKKLLEINTVLTTVYILKDALKRLWQYKKPAWAQKALEQWYALAEESGQRPVKAFAKTLKRYAYGIINHCRYPIHTSRMEGINNKIKVIKRKAYGFHDVFYFSLIIRNAFASCN